MILIVHNLISCYLSLQSHPENNIYNYKYIIMIHILLFLKSDDGGKTEHN